ncbi:hypothetical protein TSAR_014871 [Trichomalopsis sarcophagae]|uniref:Uncharacterized protein n=1 Tax=Trichomalopsis sarcophagae TaxID=543379 RepID=A0A232EDP3_9HYME|nr:hypothetical protein TSAR_014871 [Trichomalopsis sarcophagae]
MCVCSGTTRSISIKFDMHVYFWILNTGKTFIFHFSNYLIHGQFLIFEKHYFAFFFQAFQTEYNYLLFSVWSSGSTALFGR